MHVHATQRWSRFDWLLVALTVAYLAAVAVLDLGPSLRSSAEAVGGGRVWVLVTSALEATGDVSALQLLLLACAAAAVIIREGPRLWWVVALVGHVGSALIAYGIIGLAQLLDSESADRVADDSDYGVSCVLAASLGALAVSGALAVGAGSRRPADRATLVLGILGIVGLLPVSFGWYGVEHPISYVLGAAVTWVAVGRRPL